MVYSQTPAFNPIKDKLKSRTETELQADSTTHLMVYLFSGIHSFTLGV